MQNLIKISWGNTTSMNPVWYQKKYLIIYMSYSMRGMVEFASAERKMEEG